MGPTEAKDKVKEMNPMMMALINTYQVAMLI